MAQRVSVPSWWLHVCHWYQPANALQGLYIIIVMVWIILLYINVLKTLIKTTMKRIYMWLDQIPARLLIMAEELNYLLHQNRQWGHWYIWHYDRLCDNWRVYSSSCTLIIIDFVIRNITGGQDYDISSTSGKLKIFVPFVLLQKVCKFCLDTL